MTPKKFKTSESNFCCIKFKQILLGGGEVEDVNPFKHIDDAIQLEKDFIENIIRQASMTKNTKNMQSYHAVNSKKYSKKNIF